MFGCWDLADRVGEDGNGDVFRQGWVYVGASWRGSKLPSAKNVGVFLSDYPINA